MKNLHIYLNFNGNTEEAFKFYRDAFGGDFTSLVRFKEMPMSGFKLPEDAQEKIMHISLPVGKDTILMGTDALISMGHPLIEGNNFSIYISAENHEEADKLYSALSTDGVLQMPMANQPWGDYHGSLRDKFGIQWMLSATSAKPLVISRIVKAPRELVWKSWTDPERLKVWTGPRGFTTPFYDFDLQVGGKYLSCMRSSDGQEIWSTGSVLEFIPDEMLVLTDSFADDKGNVVSAGYYDMGADFPLVSRVTVTFTDEPDSSGSHDSVHSTRFTLSYDDVSTVPAEFLKGMTDGWNESFDKLEEYLTYGAISK